MSVSIRLARFGGKKSPFYRIMAADTRAPRDGRSIEQLGTYDPREDPPVVVLKRDRVNYWLSVGAKPSHTVRKLFIDHLEEPAPEEQSG